MSDSASKYYEKLEDQEYWEKQKNKTRFERIQKFFLGLLKYTKK